VVTRVIAFTKLAGHAGREDGAEEHQCNKSPTKKHTPQKELIAFLVFPRTLKSATLFRFGVGHQYRVSYRLPGFRIGPCKTLRADWGTAPHVGPAQMAGLQDFIHRSPTFSRL
jgi:hypothetical protein